MTDHRLRELERRAAAGAKEDRRALQAELCRRGRHLPFTFEFCHDPDVGVWRFRVCTACGLRELEGQATAHEGIEFYKALGYYDDLDEFGTIDGGSQ